MKHKPSQQRVQKAGARRQRFWGLTPPARLQRSWRHGGMRTSARSHARKGNEKSISGGVTLQNGKDGYRNSYSKVPSRHLQPALHRKYSSPLSVSVICVTFTSETRKRSDLHRSSAAVIKSLSDELMPK